MFVEYEERRIGSFFFLTPLLCFIQVSFLKQIFESDLVVDFLFGVVNIAG